MGDRLLELWTINDIIRDENGEITHIYISDDVYDIVACIVYPHDGNDMKYLLRAEFQRDFDKWSNCSYEQSFENEDELKEMLFPTKIYDILMN